MPFGALVGVSDATAVPTRPAASAVGSLSGSPEGRSTVRLEMAAPPSRSTAKTAKSSATSRRRGVNTSCNSEILLNPPVANLHDLS